MTLHSTPIHPSLRPWLELGEILLAAATASALRTAKALRPRRRTPSTTRRPGPDTPLWNICVALLKTELAPHGSKARLARYLGVPRQRLNDFLTGHCRLPDAELTLRLLNWLARKRTGTDLSL